MTSSSHSASTPAEQKMLSAPLVETASVITTMPEVLSYCKTSAAPWESGSYPGTSFKRIAAVPEAGLRAIILKVEPGAYIGIHAHDDEYEQLFLISGDFCDGTRDLRPGDYLLRRVGAPHEASTRYGAELLVIFNKISFSPAAT
ncbi:cupin domain-containing protein [Ramlibacter sp.]|uniref:cupin domain-containing protein n=1 Tax=Ramlibacter sp. TaxID=1917967 RepID=UPI003D11FA24